MERSKLRKIIYIYSTIILMISIIILTHNHLDNIQSMYKKDIEALHRNTIELKKNYIKDIVNTTIQQIDIERTWVIKEFNNNIDYIVNSLNLETLIKDRNEYELLIWDRNEKQLSYTSRKILLNKPILSEGEFIKYIETYKINRYKNMQNKIMAVVVSEETIEKKVQDTMKEHIRSIELSDNGYIWINQVINYDGGDNYAIRLVHPNLKNTEGEMLSTNIKDIKGNLPYLQELEGIKDQGEVFLEYYFKKKGTDIIAHKISYAKLYPKYNWVIATGVHLDDIDNILKDEVTVLQNYLRKQIGSSISIAIFLSLILAIVIFILEKKYYKIIQKYYSLVVQEKQILEWEKLKVENEYKKLENIAITDPLTNLYNRYFMTHYLQEEFLKFEKEKVNYYIAMGDVDYFKNVNDTYGHEAGDHVLKVVAELLKSNISEKDKVARWGGEEFLIVFSDITKEDVIKKINNIISSLEKQPIEYREKTVNVTISFGVSSFLKDDKNYEESLIRADKVLYHSKSSGRNQVNVYEN
ncbi:sensor domain-containing diguanylate cyclase [Clostridium malenominatum]|uniref:Sensor domain-containing diguanylate cyclase n=1 Tax=Clostridium malenominatum TaxID=1539 RepID=A0ABP3TX21_9CLOT